MMKGRCTLRRSCPGFGAGPQTRSCPGFGAEPQTRSCPGFGAGPQRRKQARGFTLLELMVVIMLIPSLGMIAAPAVAIARNDQIAFGYARQASELIHNARARSTGRGSAHLVIFTRDAAYGADKRGAILVYEALDGTAAPVGPNPSSRC